MKEVGFFGCTLADPVVVKAFGTRGVRVAWVLMSSQVSAMADCLQRYCPPIVITKRDSTERVAALLQSLPAGVKWLEVDSSNLEEVWRVVTGES